MSHPYLNTWLRPDGTEIQINDRPETEAFARAHGWVRKIEAKSGPEIKVERSARDVDE